MTSERDVMLNSRACRPSRISRALARLGHFVTPTGWLAHRRRAKLLSQTKTAIDSSGLFDAAWYLTQYPDVAAAGMNPVTHYITFGANEGRDPTPLFDTKWYLAQYPDVAAAGMNPLLHYVLCGANEGRDPNPSFDTDWYVAQYTDVAARGVNPLAHYFTHGANEGRDEWRAPSFEARALRLVQRR